MVYIAEVGSEANLPVPVGEDGFLPLQLLERYFPGAAGLMYYGGEDGTQRIPVSFDHTLTKLVPPADGWNSRVFYVVKSTQVSSLPSTSIDQNYVHNFDLVKHLLFFIDEESGYKSCVVSITSHFLVTFRHGTHSSYVKDSTVLDVTSITSQKKYKATVFYICEEQDYVILKADEKVTHIEAPIQQCDVMKKFVVCGFAKGFPELTFIHGTVYSMFPFSYEYNGKQFGPFVYGTAKTSTGDSGAACFGESGLMAINLGVTAMPKKFHDEAISEAAIFSPNNYMIPAYTLMEKLAVLQPQKSAKRPHREVIIEGMGKFGF